MVSMPVQLYAICMSKECRKERFCGLGTRLALEIRDRFPAAQQTDFEQTANFHGLLLQKGLITRLFSHLPSCFCRNQTLEGCLPWRAALGLFRALSLSKGGWLCSLYLMLLQEQDSIHNSIGFINWCLIKLMQHKRNKR